MKVLQHYGYMGLIKITLSLIKTKIFFPKARLIRFPIDIRNKKNIDFGENLTTGVGCRFESCPQTLTDSKLLKF